MNKRLTFAVTAFLAFLLVLFLQRCAKQVRPPGGPPDKTPPRVIGTIPENNATLVPRRQKIEIEFSERMDRKSLAKAVFITPDPGFAVKYKWKGRKLRIEMDDSLRADVTYVITLGTDLKDSHGNALRQSYTLAFSTGEEISHGKISGQVYDASKNKGVLVWAYLLDGEDPNPEKVNGNYTTQTDEQGKYQLTNLSEGRYRIFAVDDKDNNRFFERGTDGIGVFNRDLHLSAEQNEIQHVNFKISVQDTLGPALLAANALDKTQVKLRFDEPLNVSRTLETGNYRIREKKASESTLEVLNAVPDETTNQDVLLTTAPQKHKTTYEITVSGVSDVAGNRIDPAFDAAEFSGSSVPDTLRPKILRTTPPDSAKAVLPASNIEFFFDEPIHRAAFENGFVFLDSSRMQQPGQFSWPSGAHAVFDPAADLQNKMPYRVQVAADSVRDLAGNSLKADSLYALFFRAVNVDTFASISGTLVDVDSSDSSKIYVIARQNRSNGQTYRIELQEPGPYVFQDILPGVYRIEGFRDRDGNGTYSYGQAYPFEPAERFFVYPDSVKVRARWPNEGNDITFFK